MIRQAVYGAFFVGVMYVLDGSFLFENARNRYAIAGVIGLLLLVWSLVAVIVQIAIRFLRMDERLAVAYDENSIIAPNYRSRPLSSSESSRGNVAMGSGT